MSKNVLDIVRDVVTFSGVGLIVAGTYQIYKPAGFIVAGVFLILPAIYAVFGNR